MSNLAIPFNIFLLPIEQSTLNGLKAVTSLDIFDGMSKNFHEEGLYSSSIFGKVGDERRKRNYAYIDIKLQIFHPIVFRALCSLKRLYGDIISSKAYAVFDPATSDFVKSTPMDGETGFEFFVQHWKKIEFERRPSDLREESIKLIQKYKDKESSVLPSKIIVLPAGLRDFQIQGDGRYSEEEVNGFYKKLMNFSSSIPKSVQPEDLPRYNPTRMALQRTFNDIYDLYESMIKGKKKLMLGKWASRKIFNGTRNVITSMSITADELHAEGNIGVNDTIIGMYQYMKATLPVVKFQLRQGFLSKVFLGPNTPAMLVNKKTLRHELVNVRPEIFDSWMTDEGIERVVNLYAEESLRHKQVEIQGYYIGLVYKANGVFKFFQDISELPEGFSRDDVKPITFIELMYASIYKDASKYPLFVTRYPITTPHSTYPSRTYLKSTTLFEKRIELNEYWSTEGSPTAYQYPITGAPFVESLSPHSSKLSSLGADGLY